MGNGAKAQQKREKAGGKAGAPGAGSQLKTNQSAQTIQCKTCFNTFQKTAKKPELTQHAESKHNKTFDVCFPGLVL